MRRARPTAHRRRVVAVAAALALAVGVAGACSDDEPTTTAGGTTTPPPAATSAPGGTAGTTAPPSPGTHDTGPGIDPLLDAGLDPVSIADQGAVAYLAGIDVARHEGYDRVVFRFEGVRPGATVQYVDPPLVADGSGLEVPVAGAAALEVRMEPASVVDLSTAEVREVYTGPDRITPDTPTVAEVVQVGDFEAVARWAIGVRDRVPFRVLTLEEPARIVVDVANH